MCQYRFAVVGRIKKEKNKGEKNEKIINYYGSI